MTSARSLEFGVRYSYSAMGTSFALVQSSHPQRADVAGPVITRGYAVVHDWRGTNEADLVVGIVVLFSNAWLWHISRCLLGRCNFWAFLVRRWSIGFCWSFGLSASIISIVSLSIASSPSTAISPASNTCQVDSQCVSRARAPCQIRS